MCSSPECFKTLYSILFRDIQLIDFSIQKRKRIARSVTLDHRPTLTYMWLPKAMKSKYKIISCLQAARLNEFWVA